MWGKKSRYRLDMFYYYRKFDDFCNQFKFLPSDTRACMQPFPQHIPLRVLASFVQIISSGVSVFTVVMFCTLVSAIEFLYDDLYDVMKQTTIDKNSNRLDFVKNIRKKHLQLCKMVATVDQSLQFYVAAVFVINVGIACFTTYEMMNKFVHSTDLPDISILSFWLTSNLFVSSLSRPKSMPLRILITQRQKHHIRRDEGLLLHK